MNVVIISCKPFFHLIQIQTYLMALSSLIWSEFMALPSLIWSEFMKVIYRLYILKILCWLSFTLGIVLINLCWRLVCIIFLTLIESITFGNLFLSIFLKTMVLFIIRQVYWRFPWDIRCQNVFLTIQWSLFRQIVFLWYISLLHIHFKLSLRSECVRHRKFLRWNYALTIRSVISLYHSLIEIWCNHFNMMFMVHLLLSKWNPI